MAGDPARDLRTDALRNDPEVEAAYAAAPAHLRVEIIHGALMMSPRPRPNHASVLGRITMLCAPVALGRGPTEPSGWIILPEPEVHLGERPHKVSPDLAGWRRERMPQRPTAAAITLAPDWVCEVLSPDTETYDRGTKMALYAEYNVSHVWLADPEEQQLEVFRLEKGRLHVVATHQGGLTVRAEPFLEHEFDLAVLWDW